MKAGATGSVSGTLIALFACIALLRAVEAGAPPEKQFDTRYDPKTTHCWQDADCPRDWICSGKLGALGSDGECPPDYACPANPADALPGTYYFRTTSCQTDADCPTTATCFLTPTNPQGECQPLTLQSGSSH